MITTRIKSIQELGNKLIVTFRYLVGDYKQVIEDMDSKREVTKFKATKHEGTETIIFEKFPVSDKEVLNAIQSKLKTKYGKKHKIDTVRYKDKISISSEGKNGI